MLITVSRTRCSLKVLLCGLAADSPAATVAEWVTEAATEAEWDTAVATGVAGAAGLAGEATLARAPTAAATGASRRQPRPRVSVEVPEDRDVSELPD